MNRSCNEPHFYACSRLFHYLCVMVGSNACDATLASYLSGDFRPTLGRSKFRIWGGVSSADPGPALGARNPSELFSSLEDDDRSGESVSDLLSDRPVTPSPEARLGECLDSAVSALP